MIIYQNTKTSKKLFKGVTKASNPKTYSCNITASFSTGKPEIDLLTLRDHNSFSSHSNSTSYSFQIHILIGRSENIKIT